MDPPPKPQNQPQLPHQQQKTILPPLSLAKTYIPCSAAYAKLRKHRGWDKASMDDFPGLVRPLLVDAGEGGPAGGAAGKRCPRVEVGSLQDVLTMLDRRFGKDVL
ncbi:hypothetical protein DFH27DRAFT_570664 [Peziza echinospora]|nr:hypothetical protein DFH27DRAFT_570664 [Peziza echinospora]